MLFSVGAIFAIASCSEVEMYSVSEPEWLQAKIDSIAQEKKKREQGDTVVVDITKTVVGAEDCTTAWWGDHSQFFQIPSGELLHFEFINHTSKNNNWSQWNLVVTSTAGTSTDDDPNYAEYFVIRADAYGWGNADYSGALLAIDYFDPGKLADWDQFKNDFMEGAHVSIEVDHASAGYAYVTATATNPNYDFSITETYNQKVPSASDIYANITTDESHFQMLSAYRTKSQIQEIPDEQPVSITVSGTPASLELGDTNFWGNGIATVTFTDGTTAVADTANMVFSVPDLSTVGTKTIVYSYNLTKQGNAGTMVNGYYTLEVTNPVVSIESSATAYIIGGAKKISLSPNSIKTIATYVDGTTSVLASSLVSVEFKDGKSVYEAVPGTYENAFTVTFTSASGKSIQCAGNLIIAKSSQEGQQPAQVGFTDCTTPWWAPEGTSRDWTVAAGESQTVSMFVGSDNAGNWHSPCVVLRNADYVTNNTEYVVVRMDNYGWGGGWDAAVKTCDWNWDTFQSNINGSQVAITVSNNGDNTADIRYFVVYANGEEHFQYYDSIPVNSSDLTFAIITEASYLIFD
mgnify:CR=1 FL=1